MTGERCAVARDDDGMPWAIDLDGDRRLGAIAAESALLALPAEGAPRRFVVAGRLLEADELALVHVASGAQTHTCRIHERVWIVGPFDFTPGGRVEMEWATADGAVQRRFTHPPLTRDMLADGHAIHGGSGSVTYAQGAEDSVRRG